MNKAPEISASELVLSAIFFLQQKNGVTAAEITKFICDKRKCKPKQVKGQVKKALDRATKNGIFSRRRGLYRIENGFGEKLNALKAKERRQTNGRRKGKPKNPNNAAPVKKVPENTNDREIKTNTCNNRFFQTNILAEKNFPFQKFEVLEDKTVRAGDDDHSNSGESRTENFYAKDIKKDIPLDNEGYDDEDFSETEEDDDDDVDFFSDEKSPKAEPTHSATSSRKKSPATERNRSSDSEGDERSKSKKRKVTGTTKTFTKYPRKRAADDSYEDRKRNDYEEVKRNKRRIIKKKGKKAMQKQKLNKESSRRYQEYESENNNTGDSEEESKYSADKKESDFSNEDSDSDNVFIEGNESDRETTRAPDNSGNAQKELQKQEEGKPKEFIQNFHDDYQQQKKESFKEDVQLDKQNALQNDDKAKNSADNAEPSPGPDSNLSPAKANDCGKQSFSEPHPDPALNPPAQENNPPVDGCDRRSSQREVKHWRYSQKRTEGKKNISEHKSTKRSRCK